MSAVRGSEERPTRSTPAAAAGAGGSYGLGGSVRIFLADALMLPTGLVTVAILTRQLGPAQFGLFTIAATIVAWIEWTLVSLLSRVTVRLVGEAGDWRTVGATVLRVQLATTTVAAAALCLLAGPIAALLHEPGLAAWLRWFAIDIPLFGLAYAHRDILVGSGRYRERAAMSAGRWLTRLVLVVVLVGAGLSMAGAIFASIGASLAELVIARRHVRPSPFGRSALRVRGMLGVALPFILFGLFMRSFDRVDFLLLKASGASAADAGRYAAAQSLTLLPGIFAMSFSPVLLSSITRALRAGDDAVARARGRNALRLALLLLPFGGVVAGSASEMVSFVFGARYAAAQGVLAVLTAASLALVTISIATAVLTAVGRARLTAVLAGWLLASATVAHLLVIPRYGAIGAAIVTAVVATSGAVAALVAVHRVWRVAPPLATVLRSLAVTAGVYALALLWPTPGLLLPVKLVLLALLAIAALHRLGEFSDAELGTARRSIARARSWHEPAVRT